MVNYCCAYGCKEKFIKGGRITFHVFPKDPERRRLWQLKLRRENFKANGHTRICSKHFTDDCFERAKFGGTHLKKDAVPTVFNFPQHLQKQSCTRKPPHKRVKRDNTSVDRQNETFSDNSSMEKLKLVSNQQLIVGLKTEIGDAAEREVKVIDTDGTFSSHPNFEDIRQIQSKFIKDRNWDQYHQPRNLLLALVGEVGELAELFQWRCEVKEGLPDWTDEDKEHLSQELSDVFIYLLRLSEKCRIDLPAAVLKKIALNAQKYPASKVWGSNKKYSDYDSSSNASTGNEQ